MTSLVFDKANGLDEYRHHLDIQATLNKYPDKYKLLTCLELMTWYSALKSSSRLSSNSSYKNKREMQTKEYKKQALLTLKPIIASVCRGQIHEVTFFFHFHYHMTVK